MLGSIIPVLSAVNKTCTSAGSSTAYMICPLILPLGVALASPRAATPLSSVHWFCSAGDASCRSKFWLRRLLALCVRFVSGGWDPVIHINGLRRWGWVYIWWKQVLVPIMVTPSGTSLEALSWKLPSLLRISGWKLEFKSSNGRQQYLWLHIFVEVVILRPSVSFHETCLAWFVLLWSIDLLQLLPILMLFGMFPTFTRWCMGIAFPYWYSLDCSCFNQQIKVIITLSHTQNVLLSPRRCGGMGIWSQP